MAYRKLHAKFDSSRYYNNQDLRVHTDRRGWTSDPTLYASCFSALALLLAFTHNMLNIFLYIYIYAIYIRAALEASLHLKKEYLNFWLTH